MNRPLPLVRASTRFSSETSTGRPRSENRIPLTKALGIGVPLGPVTWPVTVPFVGGGLGRRSALGALVLAASGFGGALKKVLGAPSPGSATWLTRGWACAPGGGSSSVAPASARVRDVAMATGLVRVIPGSLRLGSAGARHIDSVSIG